MYLPPIARLFEYPPLNTPLLTMEAYTSPRTTPRHWQRCNSATCVNTCSHEHFLSGLGAYAHHRNGFPRCTSPRFRAVSAMGNDARDPSAVARLEREPDLCNQRVRQPRYLRKRARYLGRERKAGANPRKRR